MAVRITNMKGKAKATSYSDKDVGRMVRKTERVPGSVLRKTGGGVDKVLKLRGQRVTQAGRKAVLADVKAGRGGFSVLAKNKSVLKKRGSGKRSGT